MDRRTAVALCGTLGVAGVSGCLGVFGDGSDAGDGSDGDSDEPGSDLSPPEGYVRPDSDPDVVPTEFRCPDVAYPRAVRWYSPEGLHYGDTETFALRISDRSFEYGDTAEIVLRNVHSERAGTGNPSKHNLELYTEEGWIDVRVHLGSTPFPITDELVEHDPGEGLEWQVELTEEGIPTGHQNEQSIRVCPDLVSGRYRFVFGGLPATEAAVEKGVAVEFDLTVE